DGRALFLTGPEGLVSRELDSFDLLWRAIPKRPVRDPRIEAQRQMMGTINVDNSDRLDELTTRTLFHEYRGTVSTSLGLVFLIEQMGTPNEQFPSKEGVPPPNNIFVGDDVAEPNSLRAYEAESGKAVWTKGRGGPVEDGLRYAHFLSTPVVVGESLVASVQIGSDLQLAILGRDGALKKLVLLGTGQPGMFPMNGILPPAVHQGSIFIPTGAGMLIGLSTHNFSLCWQSAYKRTQLTISQRAAPRQWGPFGPATGGLAQPDEWLASPPLPCGGLVIHAPTDAESLIAINRQTGEQVWSFPRGAHRFLIGSDGRRIFIGGKSLLALDAANGQSLWSYGASPLTGRPILNAETIFAPTESGLVRLRAADGVPVGDVVAADEPLGNLLACDGALYSLTAKSITKFPDIERSRRIAELALEKNAGDRKALLRLAGLASAKKDWATALSLLERAESETTTDKPTDADAIELSERIRHQRVASLLNLAASTDVANRTPLLDRASAAARRIEDQVQVGLAQFDLLREQKEWLRAYQHGLHMLAQVGDQPITIEQELDATVGVKLAQQLDALTTHMDLVQRTSLLDLVQKATALERRDGAPTSVESLARFTRMADGLGATQQGAWLDERLARMSSTTGDHESVVYFLTRAIARLEAAKDNATTLRVLKLKLAIALSCPGPRLPVTDPTLARRLIDELRNHAATMKLPESLPELPKSAAHSTVTELLASLARLLPASRPPAILSNTTTLDVVAIEGTANTFRADVTSFWDPRHPLGPHSGVVPLQILKQVKGVMADASPESRTAWSNVINLQLDEEPNPEGDAIRLTARAAAMAGSVAVLDIGTQACAVGLTTGRMLWPPIPLDRSAGVLPDPPIIAMDATVIMATDPSTLIAVPARQGAIPMWRRRFTGKRLVALGEAAGNLVVIEAEPPTVCMLDPRSGRVRIQFSLDARQRKGQPPANADADATDLAPSVIPFAINGRVITYGGADGLVGRDLLTGRNLWTQPAPAGVLDIRRLDDEHVAITYPSNEMEIIRAENGESLRRLTLNGLSLPPVEMTLDRVPVSPGSTTLALRLLLFAKTFGDRPTFALHSIPLAAEKSPWQRELGPYASINRQMISASPDWVTVVQYGVQTEEPRNNRTDRPPIGPARILFLDKSTGRQLIENSPELDDRSGSRDPARAHLIKDVIVLDQRIIAVTPEAYYVLAKGAPTKPTRPESGRLIEPEEREEP
ncbi:MAG: PQQ-binding-like beta-propeller repeat protein, partial [Planctomycetota bacterium]